MMVYHQWKTHFALAAGMLIHLVCLSKRDNQICDLFVIEKWLKLTLKTTLHRSMPEQGWYGVTHTVKSPPKHRSHSRPRGLRLVVLGVR
jgi:predicted DNA-binding transcriptional regulator